MLKKIKRPWLWFKSLRVRNKIFVGLGLLIVLYLVYRQFRQENIADNYVTQPATKADIVQLVSESGNVHTTGRVDIYSPATGIIEEIFIDNMVEVEINQPLFRVRSTATEQDKSAAYANYQSALNSLQAAQNNQKSAQAGLDKVLDDIHKFQYGNGGFDNVGSANETQTQKTQREQAEAALRSQVSSVSSLQSQVNSAWLAYAATQNVVVKATAAGTVANLAYRSGDKVLANASGASVASAGAPVLTLANLGDYSVKVAFNEVDIPKVKVGQSAKVNLDAFPSKIFDGRVTHVDLVGTNSQGVVTYNVRVTITNPDEGIRPEMTATVDIEVDKVSNVLTVPNSAIKPYKGAKAVQVINSQTQQLDYVAVEVGIRNDERTEIKSGIEEGTQVVTGAKNIERTNNGPFGN